MLDNVLARASSVCLLALSRSDRCVLALLIVRVDCAVLCYASGAKKAKKSRKVPGQTILSSAIMGLRRAERWEDVLTMSSEVGEI